MKEKQAEGRSVSLIGVDKLNVYLDAPWLGQTRMRARRQDRRVATHL